MLGVLPSRRRSPGRHHACAKSCRGGLMSLIIDPVQLDFQGARARTLLEQKVRETISKCGVPGVGVVLVTDAGARIVTSTQGIRKLGASGDANKIQPHDKWCLGSVSKPVTGTAIGILIQKGVGG